MDNNSILFFDSGIGGLSILRESRMRLPYHRFIYVADDKSFPYGNWQEEDLRQHLLNLFSELLIKFDFKYIVLACHTASTLILDKLREIYPDKIFVGTVPAIKSAAERTKTGVVSVLATRATVNRAITHKLIADFAKDIEVNLVGSKNLAQLAEDYLKGNHPDENLIKEELAPVFVDNNKGRTDIVVLACTHYPFLVSFFRKYAHWPVDWIDPSAAIGYHLYNLAKESQNSELEVQKDLFYLTSGKVDRLTLRLFNTFGLEYKKY